LPLFTLPDGSIFFGYASWIVESFSQQHPSAHPELGESDVCVAALGESCGAGHIPVNWGTERARQIFRILDSAITTNPRKIEQVTHNGVPLPPCTGPKADPDFAQGCVFPIGPPSGVPKVWVVVVDAPINGPYGF
jgi:hypothetical protein